MEITKISLVILLLATLATSAIIHYPEVNEENNEKITDNFRNIRNPQTPKNPSHSAFNPAPFTFQRGKQQDYLKQRYAEQQQVNVEEVGKLRRAPVEKLYQNSKLEHHQNSEPYDWQPFLSTRRRTERQSEEYIPLVVKSLRVKKENKEQPRSIDKQQIDRKDESSTVNDHIIYLDPRILKQLLELKNKKKQIQSRSISIEPAIEVNSNSLNELLNKNPHIQLDSFKRLLMDPQQRNKIFPAIGGPQPFHQKDHTPITEKTVDVPNPRSKPNVQVAHVQPQNHADQKEEHIDPSFASLLPQQGQVLSKDAFEKLQKQLEESSKYQVEDAFSRAQKAAQAHVEAQHKAIEEAQRAILENVQKQLQDASPEALRLVQQQIPQFNPSEKQSSAPQAMRLVQEPPEELTHLTAPLPSPVYPTPLPEQALSPVHEVKIPTSNVRIHTYKTTSLPDYVPNAGGNENKPASPVTEHPQLGNIRIFKINSGPTQIPKHYFIHPQIQQVVISQQPKQQQSTNYLYNTISPEEEESASTAQNVVSEQARVQNIKIIKVTAGTTQVPKHFYIQPQEQRVKPVTVTQKPKSQQSSSKNIEHYAPNHLHQAAAQLQAEKVLLAQVQSHNNAIMNGKKAGSRYVGQKSLSDSAREAKNQEKDAYGSANAYQEVVLEPKQKQGIKHLQILQESADEQDDLQYAAKYAFGYRIRDNKEGNDFGHQEKRNGRSAEGSYQVLLPDGRMQKVNYYADDSGYHAKVTYENVGVPTNNSS